MYILLVVVASITGQPAKVHTYTTDTLEQCQTQEDYVKKHFDFPTGFLLQTGCYVKGDQL